MSLNNSTIKRLPSISAPSDYDWTPKYKNVNKKGPKIDWGNYGLGLLAKLSEVVRLTSKQYHSLTQAPKLHKGALQKYLERDAMSTLGATGFPSTATYVDPYGWKLKTPTCIRGWVE